MPITYVNSICKYEGLTLVPTKAAGEELEKFGYGLEDCKHILENGYRPRKRAKDTIESWLDKGTKTYNTVVVRDYNELMQEHVWVIIHFGRFTRRK